MKNSGWEKLKDEATAAKYILDRGHYKGWLPPDDEMLRKFIPDVKCAILDMCCGIGRNSVWISKNRPHAKLHAYDLENMICLGREYSSRHLGENGILFTSEFSEIRPLSLDFVICMISFQHVLPEHLEIYYPALAECLRRGSPGHILVHGRDWSDHNDREIVWERLQRHFDLVPDHPLSGGFSGATFTKDYKAGDHHRAVFRPKGVVQ